MDSAAIISDVHGNLEALQAVAAKLAKSRVDSIHFLGDAVGYGPNPGECLDILQELTATCLAGNHDRGINDERELLVFNEYARAAIDWTKGVLTADHREFLQGLPLTAVLPDNRALLVHASPHEPDMWHYIASAGDARASFPFFDQRLCCVGHSHIPFIAELTVKGAVRYYRHSCRIREGSRYIINTGSIGQPRDGDPRASCVLLSSSAVQIKRVSYDIVLTQNKMREAGLPAYLIDRLAEGR
jgi:diadenosine tetraphosphatase ApaH/serine/threonine PP2A family protein phosphatase